jgi:SAM-dependent methyltransferase
LDALLLPFKSKTFTGTFSLLADSYAGLEAFKEVSRVLKNGGFYFLTLPSKTWAQARRSVGKTRIDEAAFPTSTGEWVTVPSHVYSTSELHELLAEAGFERILVGDWTIGDSVPPQDFSTSVLAAATVLGLTPNKIPLITYALAYKRNT